MKKNYFYALFASLMLFMAMPANAQISSMTDLYGKYKFTAKITPTAAGEAYKDAWTEECEVQITKDGFGLAGIFGLAGADYAPSVTTIFPDNNSFVVINPNGNYSYFDAIDGYHGVTSPDGKDPFDMDASYVMVFSYNPDTKEITAEDFAIAGFAWPEGNCVATVYAQVTDIKMTLIEAETVVIPDIAGEWKFEGGLRNPDRSPKGFTIDLVASDETLMNWDATLVFEGYEDTPFVLPATFDGSMLTIPYDSIFLSKSDSIRLGTRTSATATNGSLEFKYNSSTAMAVWSYIYVRKDTTKINEAGEPVVGGTTYQVFEGNAYITREDPNAYDWSGVYTVAVPEEGVNVIDESMEFPTEFDVVIEKVAGGFAVTEFMGYSDYKYPITVNADGKSAEIDLTTYYGPAFLKYIGEVDGDYFYHVLSDGNGEATSLRITLQDDGTIALGDFAIQSWLYLAGEYNPYVLMSGAVAAKKKYDWAGTYTATATVVEENGAGNYPSTFDIVVEQDADGTYLVKEVMGVDVYNLNQGCFQLAVAEDGKSASIDVAAYYGCLFLGGSFPNYIIMTDAAGGANPVNVALNDDETLTMDDFAVYSFNWNDYSSAKLAAYSNVVLTKKNETSIENVTVENTAVKGIFDMQGRKIENITAPGLYIIDGVKVLVK